MVWIFLLRRGWSVLQNLLTSYIESLLHVDLIIEIYIIRVYIESINVSGFLFIIN